MPSAGEVDGGKIADRVASCRHDPQGQHGHLLAQVRMSILIFHRKVSLIKLYFPTMLIF